LTFSYLSQQIIYFTGHTASHTFIRCAACAGFTLYLVFSVASCSPKIQVFLCYERILLHNWMAKDLSLLLFLSVCLELQANMPGECS